ncbi:MAG: S41 family peptidase [Bacteroidetes bacterium]|nr:S41 family peptidase [Bacteroidota bacterium]
MKKLNKRTRKFAAVSTFVLGGLLSLSFAEGYFEISKNLEIFTAVYRELNTFYVDETQPGELMKTSIDAMLKSLDPYTVYYPESKIEDYRFMTTGQYGGIGAKVNTIDGKITIIEPYEGFSAALAGLKAGDVVIAVDGLSVVGKNHNEISDLLKGQNGTTLVLSIERLNSPEPIDISITRAEIQVPDIPYHGMIDDRTGYIALSSFTKTASAEVKKSFLALKDEGMEQLVFDLRGNGGGLLREAVNIVNLFVPKGTEVVSTKGKLEEWNKTYSALNPPLDTEIPIIVLIDDRSASASEIVSGTLQDLDRAVILGQRSFGKGLVQQTKDLSYNTKMKLTVAKYYTASGRCIQKLNYSERDETGKVKEVPDSLIKPFFTAGGRDVFDGRGIDPDVYMEPVKESNMLSALLNNYVIFDFATAYAQGRDSIAAPEDFVLSDVEYAEFRQYAIDQDFELNTQTELLLSRLEETAAEERYMQVAEQAFADLKSKLTPDKERDLDLFKAEIKKALENEIVSRYYYSQGAIRFGLKNDVLIDRSLSTFASDYYSILQVQP